MDAEQDLVHLGVRLLDIVRTGARTATYKPATLLALIDVLAAHSDASGRAPDLIRLDELGEQVLRLYWPQVRAYDGLGRTAVVLRQVADRNKGSVIVRAVRELYEDALAAGVRNPAGARAQLPCHYASTVRTVTANLTRYPLARLQRPGGWRKGQAYDRPLYDDRPFGQERRPLTDLLRLQDGVGERLLALSPLLCPLLQSEWTQQVAGLNDLPSENLREHLFGAQRQNLEPVRELLRTLQAGRCAYCARVVRGAGQIDHVVPWSLHPQDAIENLVFTDQSCNAAKSAHLLDVEPLAWWSRRDMRALAVGAGAHGWDSRAGVVFALARSSYSHPGAVRLWSPAGGLRAVGRDEVHERVLPLLQVA